MEGEPTSSQDRPASAPPVPPLAQVPPPVAPSAMTSRPTRGRGALLSQGPTRIPPSLQAKMAAMANRNAQASLSNPSLADVNQAAAAFSRVNLADGNAPPVMRSINSAPSHMGAGQRRRGLALKLSDIVGPGGSESSSASAAGLGAGRPAQREPVRRPPPPGSAATPFANFHKIVDPSGALNFSGKAVLHASGVDFSNGSSFSINMSQMQLQEELGSGNYGTVKKVLHKPTNVTMAMKEIRLELDDAKLNAILMELDILHRAVSPEIIEFYGAFFIESCVYYCMEFMDAGSLDKLQGVGVPEDVLARIVGCMTRGLKFLKDDLQIIHRDVKPTNVLVNKRGEVKLCDFGVSGQLEKSLAKTNIGCQSYMAPERIKGESQNNLGSYTVSSDVWSLGLSIIEIGLGKYPYPPETYENVFAQLTAIVHGPPPELPDIYTEEASDFVKRCLVKEPSGRATYAELLGHPFLEHDRGRQVEMESWVQKAFDYKLASTQKTSRE